MALFFNSRRYDQGSAGAVRDTAAHPGCYPTHSPFPVYSVKLFTLLSQQGRGKEWNRGKSCLEDSQGDRLALYTLATYQMGSLGPYGFLGFIILHSARKSPSSQPIKSMNQGTCIRCALESVVSVGTNLGKEVKSPWAACGCPSLYPVLLKKRPLELDQQSQLYKCLGMYPWQVYYPTDTASFPSASLYNQFMGVQGPLGNHTDSTGIPATNHLSSCSSFTVQPHDRSHPFSSPSDCSPRAPLMTLSAQNVQDPRPLGS